MNLKKTPGLDLSGSFLCLLWKWKGSLYKLCFRELTCFLVLFCTVSIVYRQAALSTEQKELFGKIVRYCDKYVDMVPLSFILGFYVTTVASRWWSQCMALPWPDRLMLAVTMYIPGSDKESKMLRKTLVQNCNLMAVLVFRSISESVEFRLRTLEDVVRAGLMTHAEMECFKAVKADVNLFWLPGLWFTHRLREAQLQGRLLDSFGAQLIMKEFLEFRSKCGILWLYDWVSIPLVYTQVVTLSTYTFCFACIFARQCLDDGSKEILIDVYFPVLTLLQILFYLGLLKVAEHMVNPHGEDDEDFNLSFLLNRHAKVINIGTNIFTEGMCPPMEDEHLLGGTGIHTPQASQKAHPRIRRVLPKFAGLNLGNKERDFNKRLPEVKISSISLDLEMDKVSSPLDLTLLPEEPGFRGKTFSWNLSDGIENVPYP